MKLLPAIVLAYCSFVFLRQNALIVEANGKAWQPELNEIIESGSAFRIVNTYCGRLLITRPNSSSAEQNYTKWEDFASYNKKMCECKHRGPPSFKYAWFFMLRLLSNRSSVSIGPLETHQRLINNETIHLLMDYEKVVYHYEYETPDRPGGYTSWTTNWEIAARMNRRVTYHEHYFSYLLRTMVPEKISITFLKSDASYWERKINTFGRGVVGFVIDPTLPRPLNRKGFNATHAYNYFKDFKD